MVIYTSIIATHQARLRCFLHQFIYGFEDSTMKQFSESWDEDDDEEDDDDETITDSTRSSVSSDDYLTAEEDDRETIAWPTRYIKGGQSCIGSLCKKKKKNIMHRFQNTSIVKFVVTSSTIQISMIYNGEVDEEKPNYVYYVTPGTNDPKANSGRYQIAEFEPVEIPNTKFKNVVPGNTYVFYLIRHGQAQHNVLKGISKAFSKKDTSLTENGIRQAKDAGEAMLRLGEGQNIQYIFASDLKRTSETLFNFLKTLNVSLWTQPIVILPCSHELAYTKNSNCDGVQGIRANENIDTCNPYSNSTNDDVSCKRINGINKNWEMYKSFYNGTRSSPGANKKQCRDTNMILLAIDYINAQQRAPVPAPIPEVARPDDANAATKYNMNDTTNINCANLSYRLGHPMSCPKERRAKDVLAWDNKNTNYGFNKAPNPNCKSWWYRWRNSSACPESRRKIDGWGGKSVTKRRGKQPRTRSARKSKRSKKTEKRRRRAPRR